MSNSGFWTQRVKQYGHTGWADRYIYEFDQSIRIKIVDEFLKKYVKWGGNLLDFGCGNGEFSEREESYFSSLTLYDICEEVLELAKGKFNEITCYSKLEDLINHTEKYDAILSITVLQHIMDDEELSVILDYWHRTLKDDGVIIVLEQFHSKQSGYMRAWNFEAMNKRFIDKGFEIKEGYDFYKNGIFKDPVFDKYRHRFDVYLLYHLYIWVPRARGIITKMLHKIAIKGHFDEDVSRFLSRLTCHSGDKFVVYGKRIAN